MNYTCTVVFDDQDADKVRNSWDPPQPDEFKPLDVLNFTGSKATWRVGFMSTPFSDRPPGSTRTFQGQEGETRGGTVAGVKGNFRFQCALWNGQKWVGWDNPECGGQVPVGN